VLEDKVTYNSDYDTNDTIGFNNLELFFECSKEKFRMKFNLE